MIPSLLAALRHVHRDLATVLHPPAIRAACRAAGHHWRDRRLDPVATVHLLILQILHRNTACAHLPRLTGRAFSPSAYCQARARLPLAVLQNLLARTADALRPLDEHSRWYGHRTVLVDGTGVALSFPTINVPESVVELRRCAAGSRTPPPVDPVRASTRPVCFPLARFGELAHKAGWSRNWLRNRPNPGLTRALKAGR